MTRNLTVLEQPARFTAQTRANDQNGLAAPCQSGPISGHIDSCLKLNKGQRDFLVLYEGSRRARESHGSGSGWPLVKAVFLQQKKKNESKANDLKKIENFPPRLEDRCVDEHRSSMNLYDPPK